jgi:hypothetical protein
MEFLRRFRETKSMCFSLNIPDDELAGMAVAGMLPAIREKLFGMEFDDLGQLLHRLSLMSNQAYGFKKDSRFVKHNDIYNQFLERADQGDGYDDEEEIAAAEIVWGKEPLIVNQRWIKQAKGTYDDAMMLILGNKCCIRGRLGVVLELGYKYEPIVFVIGIEQFHNKPAPCQLSSPFSRVVDFFERSHRSVDLHKYRQPCIMRWI